MMFIAIAGIGLSAAGMAWHYKVKNEKEQQLMFVGGEYKRALLSYYNASPSGIKQYPVNLSDLLKDNRFPGLKRHLRKIYPDPMTGKTEWGLNKSQGRIVGIYSLSKDKPFKVAGFDQEYEAFNGAKSYQDWVFGQNSLVAATVNSINANANLNASPSATGSNGSDSSSGSNDVPNTQPIERTGPNHSLPHFLPNTE